MSTQSEVGFLLFFGLFSVRTAEKKWTSQRYPPPFGGGTPGPGQFPLLLVFKKFLALMWTNRNIPTNIVSLCSGVG